MKMEKNADLAHLDSWNCQNSVVEQTRKKDFYN